MITTDGTNGANGIHAIRLPPTTSLRELPEQRCYSIAKASNERESTLRDLLVADHSTIAPLREPNLILHSHMPHILGSALDLGLDAGFLKEAHDNVVKSLISIDDTFTRGNIEPHSMREFLGKKDHTIAFVDFFDKEFEKANGDWKKVTEDYLFIGDRPLMSGLTGGLGHPIIHLAYAYELDSKETASEGLSLLCTDFSSFAPLLDFPQPDTSTYKTHSMADVLEHIRHDARFDGLIEHPGITNMGILMQQQASAVIEHWNAWEVTDPLRQLEQICDVATVLTMTTSDSHQEFDFYLLHLMTIAHGLRVLWHVIPADRQAPMLRQFALFSIAMYICQQRMPFGIEQIEAVDTKGRDWEWVRKTTTEHPAKFDVHFFKVVRAPIAFKDTYGEKDGFYLKAAILFLDTYAGFTGFGLGLDGFDPRGEQWYPE